MNCRICNCSIDKTLLVYNNMPCVAQNLPTEDNLKNDKGVDLKICQCGSCGTIQLDNEPVSYYREVIRAASVSDEMRQFRNTQFSDFIKKFNLYGKKIIEIGCGKGENLPLLKSCGANPFGLEYSEKSVLVAESMGLKACQGFVDSSGYRITGMPFDAFCMFSFLEHLPNPVETLRGISNNLSDNAHGIVEVPNTDMFLESGLFYEFMLDHLFYFTKDTLNTVLQLSGYEVLSINLVRDDYIISAEVKKRKKIELSYLEKLKNDLITGIDDYIDSYEPNKVAVWGASHQALFILAMLRNAVRLKYVVDSADFKQGKYTPVSHIPIVSPEKIKTDPIEAVIVMAAGYSDEVAHLIKERYGNALKISILRPDGLEFVV